MKMYIVDEYLKQIRTYNIFSGIASTHGRNVIGIATVAILQQESREE